MRSAILSNSIWGASPPRTLSDVARGAPQSPLHSVGALGALAYSTTRRLPRRPEAAARDARQRRRLLPFGAHIGHEDALRETIAARDRHGARREVVDLDLDFVLRTAVVL